MSQDRGVLVASAALLVSIGLLMVYSASMTAKPSLSEQVILSRHVAALGVGVVAALVALCLPPGFWKAAAVPLFFVALVLLAAVLLPGMGTKVKGAQRWFRYGPLSFQPSELAKLALTLVLARFLAGAATRVHSFFLGFMPLSLPVALTSALILWEPDFGSAVLVAAVGWVLLYAGGVRARHLGFAVLLAAPALVYLVLKEPYRVERIAGFVQVWKDSAQAPYHIKQSLVTIGSGGLWGTGLGKGWQKLSFLPEANTDFVFAVIGEELGLVGTATVVALWAGFLISGVRVAGRLAHDRFAYLASLGLVILPVLQAVINMAVVTACLPTKGMALPLASSGGTSLVANLAGLGMLLSLSRTRPEAVSRDEAEASGSC